MALFSDMKFSGYFSIHDIKNPWEILQVFSLYRLYLLIILIVLYTLKLGSAWTAIGLPRLFVGVLGSYVLFSVACVFFVRNRYPEFNKQVFMQVIGDLIILSLLIYAAGGISSGLGILMNTTVAAGSIMTVGRLATRFAFVACVAVALVQLAIGGLEGFDLAHYGIFAASFFTTAILGSVLAKRISYTEALATQRGVDLANLVQLNEHIIQYMRSGVVVIDHTGQVRLMNESARRLLGLAHKALWSPLQEICEPLLMQWRAWQKDHRFSAKTFQAIIAGPELIPQFSTLYQGSNAATLIFLSDASQVMQQAQQIKLASLGRLTASIAHEIRNPLGAISHAAQLLEEDTVLNKASCHLIEIIRTNCERVNEVIKTILQLSRREQVTSVQVKLKPWLEEFTDDFKMHETEPPHITLEMAAEEIEISIDSGQLRQVMTNLCENGIRYSKQHTGRATLLIRAGINKMTHEVFLEVIDQGPGVSPEMAPQIFEPFFTSEKTGTGLGLYIARELCEANQARLDFVPLTTGGGCFRISFRNLAA